VTRNHYYLSIADLSKAQGPDPGLAWDGSSPDALAATLQQALRTDQLFARWRQTQADPDAVDQGLALTDPAATVSARIRDLHTEVDVVTDLPMSVLRQRLNLLIGSTWQLRDMHAA
jgi:hypothetical protein